MKESSLGLFGLLAPEIRNEIYRLALCDPPCEIWVSCLDTPSEITPIRTRALTQVSRAVRRESLGVFFTLNTFIVPTGFDNNKRLLHWLQKIVTPSYFPCLREVVVWHDIPRRSSQKLNWVSKEKQLARFLRPYEEVATLFFDDRYRG